MTETPETTADDLFAGLWRRRTWIMAVTLLIGVLGTAASWLGATRYDYRTVLEIGRTVERDAVLGEGEDGLQITTSQTRVLEYANEVVGKLEGGYIAEALRQYAQRPDAGLALGDIEVEVERSGSNLVKLTSTAGPDRGAEYKAVHAAVVDRVKADHAALVEAERERLRQRVQSARARGERYKTLLDGVDDADAEDRARWRERLATARAQQREYAKRLEAVQPTRASVLAARSVEPVGGGTVVWIGLAWMVAILMGVLVGGVVDTIARLRDRTRSR